jgi:hypothetical protein
MRGWILATDEMKVAALAPLISAALRVSTLGTATLMPAQQYVLHCCIMHMAASQSFGTVANNTA